MDGTPFHATLTAGGAAYTVPAGKKAVFALFGISWTQPNYATTALIAGAPVGVVSGNGNFTTSVKPLTANAGEVVSIFSTPEGATAGISGLLYDVT